MIVVFRCSARNWLLFVVAPPAVFMVCARACVSLCVYMCIYKCMCLRALHAGLCVYVCVEVRIFFVPPQMCQCSVWSPAQLFHVIVPPLSARCLRPAWSPSPLHPLCPANLLSLPLAFPWRLFFSPYVSLCSIVPLFLITSPPSAFTPCLLSINGDIKL